MAALKVLMHRNTCANQNLHVITLNYKLYYFLLNKQFPLSHCNMQYFVTIINTASVRHSLQLSKTAQPNYETAVLSAVSDV